MKTKTRNITLSLDKAKEWYKQGGELKEVALQAYGKEELEEFNSKITLCELGTPLINLDEQLIAFYNLKHYISYYNGKNFDHGKQKGYYPRIWWYKNIQTIPETEKYVGYVVTKENIKLYVSVGGFSAAGLLSGLFSCSSDGDFSYSDADFGAQSILACKTEELRAFVENHFAKEIIEAFYGQWIKEYHLNQ